MYRPVSLRDITWVGMNLTIIAGKRASKVIAGTKVLNKDRHDGKQSNYTSVINVDNQTSKEAM